MLNIDEKADLFSPIRIGELEVKNRIIMPAFILNFPIEGFRLGEEWKRFYRRRAAGGAGLIIVGACHVHPAGRQDVLQIGADHDDWLPELENVARLLKKGGAVPALQLNHAGRYALREITGMDPVAPSAIGARYTREIPRALTTGEVEEVLECFAQAAHRAKKAGFEAIELLGATGYLISQFVSPVTNKRADRFALGPDGRFTFVKELIQGIQAKLGKNYPIIFRLSSKDNIPGGLDENDQRALAVKLAGWGVDLINVTAGWHDAEVHQIGPSIPQGHFIPYATRIKGELEVPVSCAMRITRPDFARKVIEENRLDMVTLGRALIADPDWPRKVQAGEDQTVRQCICCCHCFDRAFARSQVECSINASLGREDLEAISKPKKILVIGGGPAGMEAARVLKRRGHRVVLKEREASLGGRLGIASAPPHKQELLNLSKYLSGELNRLGVDIQLNDLFDSLENGFDGIIVATGGKEKKLEIAGMENIPCYVAAQVLSGQVSPEGPVIIVGAGTVGGETAEFLSLKGIEVTLVEIQKKPLSDMGASLRWPLLSRLKKVGVTIYTSSEILEINKASVRIRTSDGEITVKAGSLVFAVGFEPEHDVAEKVKKTGVPYCIIGDGMKPRRIKEAVWEGYEAATTWVDGLES